jgi:hypothetical protein
VEHVLATAHTWRGGDGGFTIAPMGGLLLTLLLIRVILRLRIDLFAFAISIACGALFATMGAAVGFGTAIAVWVGGALLLAFVRSRARSFPRNASD